MKKIYKVSIFAVIILIAAVILYELVIKKNAGYKSEEISAANKILQKLTGISLILQKKNLQQNHLKTIVNLTR